MAWLEPEQTVAPTFEPVSLEDLKAHLKDTPPEDDALLTGYLAGAVQHIQNETGVRFAKQTVKLRTCGLWGDTLVLPIAPLDSVEGITYVDTAGADQLLSDDIYAVYSYGRFPRLALKPGQSWPLMRSQPDAVTIEAVVGYDEGELPDPLRIAVLMICGDWYQRPENTVTGSIVAEMPIAVKTLLQPYMRPPL